MQKFLFALGLFLFSAFAFAETLTPDMVQQIHNQVKTSFFDGCSKNVTGTGVDICRCLAEKTQAALDNTALSQCNNDDSGKECVVNVVKAASVKATSKENVLECKKKAGTAQPITSKNLSKTRRYLPIRQDTRMASNKPVTTHHKALLLN